jgi:hypothetical protein
MGGAIVPGAARRAAGRRGAAPVVERRVVEREAVALEHRMQRAPARAQVRARRLVGVLGKLAPAA